MIRPRPVERAAAIIAAAGAMQSCTILLRSVHPWGPARPSKRPSQLVTWLLCANGLYNCAGSYQSDWPASFMSIIAVSNPSPHSRQALIRQFANAFLFLAPTPLVSPASIQLYVPVLLRRPRTQAQITWTERRAVQRYEGCWPSSLTSARTRW